MGVNKREQTDVKRLLKASKEAQRKPPASAKLQKSKPGAATSAEVNQAGLHKKLRAMITRDEVGERPSVTEPPFTYEVHGKRQTLTVDVTLHKIPPQFIDISETTDRKLVVDTTKYTKRYRLEFPFPSNMVVEAENGDYTLQNGVLRASFAITSMPKDVLQQTEKVIESVKAGRKLRFRYDENGDLKIRSRSAKIALPKNKAPAKKTTTDDGKSGKAQAPESAAPSANSRKRHRDGEEGAPQTDASKKASGNKSAFVDDDAAAAIAKTAARDASKTLAKKTAEMRRREVSTVKRDERRDERRNLKSEKEASSFSSLLAEKKRALQERIALAAAPPRKQAASGKAVRFSAQ